MNAMADVQFTEERQYAPRTASSEPRGITKLVIATGLATSEQGALKVLVIACILALLGAVVFFSIGDSGDIVAPRGTSGPPGARAR